MDLNSKCFLIWWFKYCSDLIDDSRSVSCAGPSLTLNMKTVSKRLKDCRAKYSSLGLHLGVSFSLIKEFETTRGDAALCLLHMLDYYLANGEPSVREMCEALETAERRDVSRSISEKYHGESSSSKLV